MSSPDIITCVCPVSVSRAINATFSASVWFVSLVHWRIKTLHISFCYSLSIHRYFAHVVKFCVLNVKHNIFVSSTRSSNIDSTASQMQTFPAQNYSTTQNRRATAVHICMHMTQCNSEGHWYTTVVYDTVVSVVKCHGSVGASSSWPVCSESCWLEDWMYIGSWLSWNSGYQQIHSLIIIIIIIIVSQLFTALAMP